MKVDYKEFKISTLKLEGIYRGVVEDNADPTMNGRCKIRVFGVHSSSTTETATDGIATANLPWAEPVLGLIEGSISGYGLFSVPLQGSHVFVFFENGNHTMPRYFGSAPGTVATAATPPAAGTTIAGFTDPDGVYPDRTGTDFPTEAQTGYPNNIVLKTHGGHLIEIDSAESAKRLKIYHGSGTTSEIDNDGNVTTTIVKNESKDVTEARSVTIGTDDSLTISGDWTVTVAGDANITVTGVCNVTGNPVNLN
jgi:hypothetical protein